jgi:hypothetical protein
MGQACQISTPVGGVYENDFGSSSKTSFRMIYIDEALAAEPIWRREITS